ncbi:MAG: glutamate-5-semialdehyde dehydrogenase [Alphaproteobacteria bacterium]
MSDFDTNLQAAMYALGQQAVAASRQLGTASTDAKNRALRAAAEHIRARADEIEAANKIDMEAGRQKGLKNSFLDRLLLTQDRIEGMAAGVAEVANLPEPVGKILEEWDRPSGLHIQRVSVPLGVIGVIYESRPNVTADAAALCLKAGNATILRGGSDSFHSSGLILECMQQGMDEAGLPATCVQRIGTTNREAVGMLLKMSDTVDVIVPRGGKGLIARIQDESRIPVFSHLDGNCHTYVDASADIDKAHKVTMNAKMRRTGICGATETLLVHKDVASVFLPKIIQQLQSVDCEVRGDAATQKIATSTDLSINVATTEDWDTEYADPILAVAVVDDVQAAIDHINTHGSHHTEAVLAQDAAVLKSFCDQVDAGIIMQNASTQFADGGEFGMGGEIGISTGKMHARGPVGAAQLTSYKYLVAGDGTVRP